MSPCTIILGPFMLWLIFVMSESAHNIVKYIVITVEFVFTLYEEGSGNGVCCEVLHSCIEKRAVISGHMFRNGVIL